MTDQSGLHFRRPAERPACPNFSSGPCKKHPGWALSHLRTDLLGRSHRSSAGLRRLSDAIRRSCRLLGLPSDWVVGIVPGSGTGAIEFALWNLLGPLDVDVIVSDGFSGYWAHDVRQIMGSRLHVRRGLPAQVGARAAHDTVLVYNGTGNGVCIHDLRWIPDPRDGLVIADATSAAFAIPLDFSKLDAITWSWQKGLGSEAGQGMVAFGPRALERARTCTPAAARPKLLNFRKADGSALHNLFQGHTISTPSLLALEDLHSALDWAEAIGGLPALWDRVQANYAVFKAWVARTSWIDWLVAEEARSPVSICLRLVSPDGGFDVDKVSAAMISLLEAESVAFDIFTMHDAPAGFRIWAGPTVDSDDLRSLTRWLDWAFLEATRDGVVPMPMDLSTSRLAPDLRG
jgi:phosphoserine aminotransferase